MIMKKKDRKGSVVYLSHGGGPLPILGDPGHRLMVKFMQQLPSQLSRPDAVIVVSAHWEEQEATLIGHPSPPMLYDYYGFPPKAYEIDYPAPGHPQLAEKTRELLERAGLSARINAHRGFDHGLFIPLKMMYPAADIPAIQLSLVRGLDPDIHIRLGMALQPLLEENILVIGSGFSFHNIRALSWDGGQETDEKNDEFQDWLIQLCTSVYEEDVRNRYLREWEAGPHARYCHPREEHLLPLHVCCGLTQSPAKLVFNDMVMGKRAVAFLWN
jgi:aromatic ring-opening dioxygenase catalytic subunit (LigB family)